MLTNNHVRAARLPRIFKHLPVEQQARVKSAYVYDIGVNNKDVRKHHKHVVVLLIRMKQASHTDAL
eukprot:3437980-Lingulodinium_polyedra.AAC.1